MSLSYDRKGEVPESGTVNVDRHWYLTEDGERVVEEGDPRGRWLWAAPGVAVSRAEALRLGALQPEPEPAPEPPTKKAAEPPKKRAPVANKSMPLPEDK